MNADFVEVTGAPSHAAAHAVTQTWFGGRVDLLGDVEKPGVIVLALVARHADTATQNAALASLFVDLVTHTDWGLRVINGSTEDIIGVRHRA